MMNHNDCSIRKETTQFFFSIRSIMNLIIINVALVLLLSTSPTTVVFSWVMPMPTSSLMNDMNHNMNHNNVLLITNNNIEQNRLLSSSISSSTIAVESIQSPASSFLPVQQQQLGAVVERSSSHILHRGASMWLSSLPSSSSLSTNTATTTTTIAAGATTTATAQQQPSKQDILLLRNAFAEFYGMNKNYETSLELLSQTIDIWIQKKLPPDELSALYRVRGDCYMELGNAINAASDYNNAIELIKISKNQKDIIVFDDDSESDDQIKSEYIIALLGRARANRNIALTSTTDNKKYAIQSSNDYENAIILSSRYNDYDDKIDSIIDGSIRNPYATWEWGSTLRLVNDDWTYASQIHTIASKSFDEIGDKAHGIISYIDSGIDLAATASKSMKANNDAKQEAITILRKGIQQTKGITSRDIPLLRHVIVKEGEGRIVLASLLWNNIQTRSDAETILGDACIRLDQLQTQLDIQQVQQQKLRTVQQIQLDEQDKLKTYSRVLYSIDDEIDIYGGIIKSSTCYPKKTYMNEQLHWPDTLQQLVVQLETLK